MVNMTNQLIALMDLFKSVWRTAPVLVAISFALMLVSGVLEGIGMFMLIPILELLGVGSGLQHAAGQGGIVARLAELFAFLSITPTLRTVLGIFLAILAVRFAVNFATGYSMAQLTSRFHHAVRMHVYSAISGAGWPYLVRHKSAALSHAVTAQADHISGGAYFMLSLGAALISLAAGLAVAFLVSFRLTLAVIAVGVVLAVPMALFSRRSYRLAKQSWAQTARLYDRMARHFLGLKTAKILGAEQQLEAEFSATSMRRAELDFRASLNNSQAALFYEAGSALFLVGFVYLVVSVFRTSGVEPIVLIIVFARIVPRAQNAQSRLRMLLGILPDFEAAEKLVEEAKRSREPVPAIQAPLELREELRFANVEFSYGADEREKPLDGVSLSIPARSAIALVGPSGAGKTTLADLACGLISPTAGRILIDDVELDAATRLRWRASTAYVLQDEFLANTSVIENMRIGNPQASEESIWRALESAKADDLIAGLPSGLDTEVGENGIRLSRGQRQRLCLARALLRDPSFLILDEATSALNPVDEAKLVDALRALTSKSTVLVIAHRVSSISWVDEVVVLDHGRIQERGGYSDLLNDKEGFLHRMQANTERVRL